MDKIAALESLGFSKEYINRLEQYEKSCPKFARIEFETPVTVIDFAPVQDLTIMHDPKTAYSNYTINS